MSSRTQASWKTPTMPVGPSYVDCSSLSRSTSSGSVAVPVTGIGRVCGVSASRAPEGDHELAAEVVAGGQQLGAELAPAHVRLDAAHQDHVAVEVRGRGDRDLGARPGDPAVAVLVGADDRAG